MNFEDIKFPGKNSFKRSVISEVYDILSHNLEVDLFYYWSVINYLEILIDCTDFNPRDKIFYHKSSGLKLSYNFLASVAHDYILDHVEDFKSQG